MKTSDKVVCIKADWSASQIRDVALGRVPRLGEVCVIESVFRCHFGKLRLRLVGFPMARRPSTNVEWGFGDWRFRRLSDMQQEKKLAVAVGSANS